MPLYHFTTIEGGAATHGYSTVLPDLLAARKLGSVFAGDLLRELQDQVFLTNLELQVTDHTGLMLLNLTIVAAECAAITRFG